MELASFYTEGPGTVLTDDVRRILGRGPRRLDQFLGENASRFGVGSGTAREVSHA
jgi:hypothetical protein